MNGIVYKDNAIDFVSTEEGWVKLTGGAWNYEYHLKDHLGNTRVSIDRFQGAPRVIQEDEYYSFGLRKPTGWFDYSNNNRYLYNGKEIQTDLANQYDYGARLYGPVIARWNVVDPLAEKHYNYTPYNYTLNNAVKYIDPLGLDAVAVNSTAQVQKGDQIEVSNGNYVTASTGDIVVSPQKSENLVDKIANTASDIWNSPMARAHVPDKLTLSLSSSVTAFTGFSTALSFDFITRGHDASAVPYVTLAIGGQVGADVGADALIGVGAAYYSTSDMRSLKPGEAANGLLGWTVSGSGEAGFIVGANVTGSAGFSNAPLVSKPTWVGGSISAGAMIGGGVAGSATYSIPLFPSQFKK